MRTRLLLLFGAAAACLCGQQAIYENFNSGVIRQFTAGSPSSTGDLYFPSMAAQYHECPAQTGGIENGMWVERTQDCQGMMYLYWYIMNSYGGWNDWNVGFWRAWMLPGETWNPSFNRFSFRFRCDYPAQFYAGGNGQVGTFDKDPAAQTGQGESDNYHFYHNLSFNMTPFRWVWATINDKPQHQRSVSNSWSLAPNPTRFPNYFDYMTKAYINFMPAATANWGACYFDDLTFSTTAGEADWYVSSLTGQYTGTRYEVAWMTPLSAVLTYDVRYSTSGSLKSIGFSNGTDGGTVKSGGGGNVGMYWAGPDTQPASGGLYVAIKPRMVPQGATAGATTSLNMWGHGLQAGDGLECSGLAGLTPSSFTTTVASVTDWQNITVAQSTTGAYTGSGGWCRATSETSRFTEFYIPPDPASAPMAPVSPAVAGVTTTTAALSWNPDPMAASTVIERSVTGENNWTTVGTVTGSTFTDTGLASATAYDYRFRGSNAYGTSGPTQVPITAVTASDAGAPAITTTDLPAGTTGTPYSALVTATGGSAPYTFSIISGALPAGLSFSAGAISGTPAVITPQAGSPIRVRVVGRDGAASSALLTVAVNAAFPVTDTLLDFAATYANWARINYTQNLVSSAGGVHSYNWQLAEYTNLTGWYADDQWAQAQITALPAAGRVGVGVRMQSGQGPWGCVADATQVCVRSANVSSSVITDAPCASVSVNAGDYVRADVAGSTLTCSLNGVPVVSGTTAATSGRPGLLTNSQTGLLANFSAGPADSAPAQTGAEQVIENYACAYPTDISAGSPAVVTCPSAHGFDGQRGFSVLQFNAAPANNATVAIDGVTYTFVTALNNAVANQVLIGGVDRGSSDAAGWSAMNLAHAINGDADGRGVNYSVATLAHPRFTASHPGSPVYVAVTVSCRDTGVACLSRALAASADANASFDTPAPRIEWTVNASGGTGSWAAMGSRVAPNQYRARLLNATQYALYDGAGRAFDTSSYGPYAGQSITLARALAGGTAYPAVARDESWSVGGAVTADPSFELNVPGCANRSHEAECDLAHRAQEGDSKHPGVNQEIASFVVSGEVATVKLRAAYPYNGSGSGQNLTAGSLVHIRHVQDMPGAWTHRSTHINDATGTAANRVVKFAPGTNKAARMQPFDRGGAIGICESGCGAAGSAVIADAGLMACEFDNAAVVGHWVEINQADDRCHDYGSAYGGFTTQPIGVVLSGGAGVQQIWWNGLNRAFAVQTVDGPGDGSGVTTLTLETPGYPDGSYGYAALPGYPGPLSSAYAWAGTSLTVSPYVSFSGSPDVYTYPASTQRGLARNQAGLEIKKQNRIQVWVRHGKNVGPCAAGGGASRFGGRTVKPGHVGTVDQPYHEIADPAYTRRWTFYSIVNAPAHVGSAAEPPAYNYPADYTAANKGSAITGWAEQTPYFDALSTMYFDLHGPGCQQQDASGQSVTVSPVSFKRVTGEPDELVRGYGGVWAPRRFQAGDTNAPTGAQGYDLFWATPRGYPVQYEIRYSTAGSLKNAGFSTGLCQGGTTTCTAADRVTAAAGSAAYSSAAMPEAPEIWWGIKPVSVPVLFTSGSGQSPIWIGTPVDLMLSTVGDHVTVAGVGGNTAANVSNAATVGAVGWQTWRKSDPGELATVVDSWSNSGGAVQLTMAGHLYNTGDTVVAASNTGYVSGEYTITVVDADRFVLNGSSYTDLCPGGCSGGTARRLLPHQLSSIVSDGAACTVTLSVNHNLVAGWLVYVAGSSNPDLTPPGEAALYTVTGTPSAQSFTFACPGVAAGSYGDETPTRQLAVQAFPAVAVAGAGNGAYSSGGAIYSTEDMTDFTEIRLYPFGAAPAVSQRFGGPATSNSAALFYNAAGNGECSLRFGGFERPLGDSGTPNSRVLELEGLAPATSYAFRLKCGAASTEGEFSTAPAATAAPATVTVNAFPPRQAAGADNLVLDYGPAASVLTSSGHAMCGSTGSCAASLPAMSDSVLWVRRRWCKNGAADPTCANPANELARSTPQPVTVP